MDERFYDRDLARLPIERGERICWSNEETVSSRHISPENKRAVGFLSPEGCREVFRGFSLARDRLKFVECTGKNPRPRWLRDSSNITGMRPPLGRGRERAKWRGTEKRGLLASEQHVRSSHPGALARTVPSLFELPFSIIDTIIESEFVAIKRFLKCFKSNVAARVSSEP